MNKTVAELFAGVGGFRVGLESADPDFDTVFASQWEPGKKQQHAFECYTKRFDKGIHSNQDISTVPIEDIPEHNLLVGGFPCQNYSVAATGAEGIVGEKGVLFWEIVRILEAKRPPFVLLENVDRLLKSPSNKRGRDFGVILSTFEYLGYRVEWRVLNAAEHGFTQKRKRTFIFAYHADTSYAYQSDLMTSEELIQSAGFFASEFKVDVSKTSPIRKGEVTKDLEEATESFAFAFENAGLMRNGMIYTKKVIAEDEGFTPLQDILQKNVPEKYYLTKEKEERFAYLKGAKKHERVSKTGHAYTFAEGAIAYPDHLDKPGRTMLTSEASVNRTSHVVQDPETGRLRFLTPLECERLNGFPDNWTNTGMTERMRYFTMGNALVVGLVERMGKNISKIIDEEE